MKYFSELRNDSAVFMAVLVASLGYFVDVFDIALFGMLRVASLKDLGLNQEEILHQGVLLLNMQLAGMILGGIIWGILGDKIGRIQVLFGSIFLYSIANLANAFVTDVTPYILLRFIAGVGLAGEVGAGVTLVSELMSKRNRGIGTMIVAATGTAGAAVAGIVVQLVHWRTAYVIGGVLGLLLLLMRIRVSESSIFNQLKANKDIKRGSIKLLLRKDRLKKYLACILAGTPLFFSYYIMIMFCPELGVALGIKGELQASKAGVVFTIAMTLGDIACGVLSQYLQSRKKALISFVLIAAAFAGLMLNLKGVSPTTFYYLCFPAGFFMGYWAVYVTIAAEQFGTNIRATVASTVPNFVRVTPIVLSYLLIAFKPYIGTLASFYLVGSLAFACSLFFLTRLKDTFAVDLDYIENDDLIDSKKYVYKDPEPRVVGID